MRFHIHTQIHNRARTEVAVRVGIVRPQRERRRESVARGWQIGQRVLCAAQQLARPEVGRLQPRRRPARVLSPFYAPVL